MKFIRVLSISAIFSTVLVASCSVVLPRAPHDLEETVVLDVTFSDGLRTEGRLTVTRKMMNLTFSRGSNVSCLAVFPGKDVKSTFTCRDRMTGSVKVHWHNGRYTGSATFSDGLRADFFPRQQHDYQSVANGDPDRKYRQP